MANNVEVTAGSGTTFKTTDTAGVHTGHVNVDASALPTGAATAANQATIIGHVDGLESLLGTIDADTSAIAVDAAAIEVLLGTIDADTSALAGAVDGTEMQVDVVAALPAGDNNIGNVDLAQYTPVAAGADDVTNATQGLPTHALNYAFDGTTWDRVRGTSADGMLVNLGTNNDVTLATLPDTAAGDLAALVVDAAASEALLTTIDADTSGMATSLAVIDDWDESDRAKVNPIVGQAGVAAGAGAVGVTVQRTTLASDDPAVVALQIMDDWDESDRAKVNPIVGQAGVAAGAGAVGATVQRTTLASDDPAVAGLGGTADAAATAGSTGSINAKLRLMTTQLASLTRALDGDYETVAASQTDQMMGATGAAGDYLAAVIIIPATTSPGAVSIEDGSTNIPIFTGGADSVTNLVPFRLDLGMVSTTGGWEITTGANVSVIGVGSFT